MRVRYTRACIESFGYELAPVVVTSAELEARLAPLYKVLHLQEGQLQALTGIEERRWWAPGARVGDGAAVAAQKAVENAGVDPSTIDAVVYAGVCRDGFEPATACRVAASVGASPEAAVYDVSNACLGVMNGIVDLANRVELGQIRRGLVVACETAREINDVMIEKMLANRDMEFFKKAMTTLTGGSAAVAVVVGDARAAVGDVRRRILGGAWQTAPEWHGLCRWGLEPGADGRIGPFMNTDSPSVLKYGVELGVRTWRAFLARAGWAREQVDRIICHQVGMGHQESILRALGIPPGKEFPTYRWLGNMGTVSLPLTAALAEEQGFLKPGHRVGFLGIGSGLNCLMIAIEW
jgi:3-oxoacyl-[acyl-carrier-protein] synthase-3